MSFLMKPISKTSFNVGAVVSMSVICSICGTAVTVNSLKDIDCNRLLAAVEPCSNCSMLKPSKKGGE